MASLEVSASHFIVRKHTCCYNLGNGIFTFRQAIIRHIYTAHLMRRSVEQTCLLRILLNFEVKPESPSLRKKSWHIC